MARLTLYSDDRLPILRRVLRPDGRRFSLFDDREAALELGRSCLPVDNRRRALRATERRFAGRAADSHKGATRKAGGYGCH